MKTQLNQRSAAIEFKVSFKMDNELRVVHIRASSLAECISIISKLFPNGEGKVFNMLPIQKREGVIYVVR